MKRLIDMDTYPRRDHFEHFLAMACPYFNITNELDVTDRLREAKEAGVSSFLALQYDLMRAVNDVPAFRQRLTGDGKGIVEYDACGVSWIVLTKDGSYRYAAASPGTSFSDYLEEALRSKREAEQSPALIDSENAESCVYVSCVPWFPFTGITMPFSDNRFSVPSFTFGKYIKKPVPVPDGNGGYRFEERTFLPFSLMAHHSLVDGSHVGALFAAFEKYRKQPLF